MDALCEGGGAEFSQHSVRAVVIDYESAVYIEDRAIVGGERELVVGWLFDPEPARVINGKPFEMLGDAGKAGKEILLGYVEAGRVDGADWFELGEIRELFGPLFDAIDLAFETTGDDDGGTEPVFRFVLRPKGGGKTGQKSEKKT